MMKRRILLSLTLFLLLLPLRGQNPQQVFDRANQLYQQNQFAQAQGEYEKLLQNGCEGAELEYNLGNACYKSGQLAKAILHYERARKLNPGDEDLRHNLRLAALMITDKIEVAPRFFLWQLWDRGKAACSMDAITWLSYGCFAACLGAIALLLHARTYALRRFAFITALACGAGCLLFFATFLAKRADTLRRDSAIVMNDIATLKNAPDALSSDAFVLHGGVKVQVLDQVGQWLKIRIADGNVGWIEQKAVEVI